MTGPFNIFVSSDLERTLTCLARLFATPLARDEGAGGPVFRLRMLNADISAFDDHGLDDDSGMAFSQYACQIDVHALRAGGVHTAYAELLRALAVYAGEYLSRELSCRTLVADDLQMQLAEFGAMHPSPTNAR